MFLRTAIFWLSACLLLFCVVTVEVSGRTRTVKVDCSRGKSINKALKKHKNADELIIEIDGICYENVRIADRRRVTLIGDNRVKDGIHGVSTDLEGLTRGTTIVISRSAGVRLENLTISGGIRHGISVGYSNATRVEDCIVEGNAVSGLTILASSNVGVFNSEIIGTGGTRNGVEVGASIVELTDTSVIGGALRSLNGRNSIMRMTGGTLDGAVSAARNSLLQLFSVTQNTLGGRPNRIDESSQLMTNCTNPRACNMDPTSLLDTSLSNFSNANFANSTLDNLSCSGGSDAVCDAASTPANAAGTGCPLCP